MLITQVYKRLSNFFGLVFDPKNKFQCPICNFHGNFLPVKPETGIRKYAKCPSCGSLERHRLQFLVFEELCKTVNPGDLRMLHVAPEPFFIPIFRSKFKEYISAGLDPSKVDRMEDLTSLSLTDGSVDFVFASHVLEHIQSDLDALAEIARVLRPNGIAVLPVPVMGDRTVEYPEPNPFESGHVRSPGMDYCDRYRLFFHSVKIYRSSDFDPKYQTYIYEKRDCWPETMPLKPTAPGYKHEDIVPVCYKHF